MNAEEIIMNAEEIIAVNNALTVSLINHVLAKPMWAHLLVIPEVQNIIHSSTQVGTITGKDTAIILNYMLVDIFYDTHIDSRAVS